jgi:hypothetical protein
MQTTDVTAAQLGWVLAHELRAGDGRLLVRKGAVLDTAALECWPQVAPGEVHLVELEPDELHEDVAGLRVAQSIAGTGIRVVGPLQSRYDLEAEYKGMLRVDADLVRAMNYVRDVTVYTLLDRQPVAPGAVVASVKITPLAIREARIAAAEQHCRNAAQPLLYLVPFQPQRVAVVLAEDLAPEQLTRFRIAIEDKLRWFGSTLTELRCVRRDALQVADALRACLDAGSTLVLAAGGNTIDPLDPVAQALPHVGARLVHSGAPTRGSMSWLAQAGVVSILNLDSSRMYLGPTVGDVYLPLLMTGQQVTPDDLREIGYGGLPGSAIALRFPPYDADPATAPTVT